MKSNVDTTLSTLSTVIGDRKSSIIRSANADMITLFWQIGKRLKLNGLRGGGDGNEAAIRNIASQLSAHYGAFFSERNLKQMILFTKTYPDLNIVNYLTNFLGWGHFLLLVKIKDDRERRYYELVKIQQGLTVKELRERIVRSDYFDLKKNNKSKGEFQTANQKRTGNNYFEHSNFNIELLNKNYSKSETVFGEKSIALFRKLMNSHYSPIKTNNESYRLLLSISDYIERYKKQQNIQLNCSFSILLWEIGKTINEAAPTLNKRKVTIQSLSGKLKSEYGIFNETSLLNMAKFAEQVPDNMIAIYIANLTTWRHIELLLYLKETGAMVFYTHLINKENLTATQLQQFIERKTYEQSLKAGTIVKNVLNGLKCPETQFDISKTENGITSVKVIAQEIDALNNRNILANKDFIDFIKN